MNKTRILPFTSMILLFFAISARNAESQENTFPFLNPELSIDDRVDDLVGRMTLEEKVSQMVNQAPAIERLQVPEYNWWAEGLHGVARAGLATVFPQAIGLGATWDQNLMFRVATAISDEARAKHHNFVRKGKRFLYQGLTFWSPNINIFRDPRWGRGQETYGEDPYLTGRIAVQFIRGMQGDDARYFKTIATVKHFAVHNGPEPERHHFDALTDMRDFKETYLPQFEMGIKEGKAYSVMCAYNRYNGEACCGSDRLLTDLLRNDWGFDGYVVSDCGAIRDIYQFHKLVPTPEEAAALAVKSGCDLNCGNEYASLNEAVGQNLITEEDIDLAVKRLFKARFKLGMFDPEEMVEYTKIPYSIVDSEKHKQLALEAARKSIVLLKNEDDLLPLKKDLGTVAVIGPNSDQWLMLLGNYNGVPSDPVTPLRGIREKLGRNTRVMFAQGCELAEGMPMFYPIPAQALFHGGDKAGLRADFFDNNALEGDVLYSSVFEELDINWSDRAPRDDMDDDDFGVRWTGDIEPGVSGNYRLGVVTTCNTRLYLNDSLIADTPYHFRNEYGDPRLRKSDPVYLESSQRYKIKVEAGESYADAQVQLVWAAPKPGLLENALEAARQADAVILCMGLTARMEGEEMDIEIEGFRGGDRTRLDLPSVQQNLIKEIQALGKPTVLVLLNGSALAVNWENENIPAIIEAWYPGQAAGAAIADVIFGDYNPGGRLPVTFYKSANDLPSFEDYEMSTQTYRYFPAEPLYPFGYGLSYTSFSYSDLQLQESAKIGQALEVSATVKNTGGIAGEEVVQLYVANAAGGERVPLRSLKGFTRIHLEPDESRTVTFSLPPDSFSMVDNNNNRVVSPGEYEISVGGGQPLTHFTTKSNVLQATISLH